jgi:hypothetical protein
MLTIIQAIARILETVPQSTNTLVIRTDSQYSQNGLDRPPYLSYTPILTTDIQRSID